MPKSLFLMRHGQTVRNALEADPTCRLVYVNAEAREKVGFSEDRLLPLSGKGEEQAIKTGEALRDNFPAFDFIIHSGFLRTRYTAVRISVEANGTKETQVFPDFDIRERDPGFCYNLTKEELEKYFPWFLSYWVATDYFTRTPPGGESVLQMCSGRLKNFLKKLEEPQFDGKNILVVSHCNAIIGLRCLLESWDYDQAEYAMRNLCPPNVSVTAYDFDHLHGYQLRFANKIFTTA